MPSQWTCVNPDSIYFLFVIEIAFGLVSLPSCRCFRLTQGLGHFSLANFAQRNTHGNSFIRCPSRGFPLPCFRHPLQDTMGDGIRNLGQSFIITFKLLHDYLLLNYDRCTGEYSSSRVPLNRYYELPTEPKKFYGKLTRHILRFICSPHPRTWLSKE
jgi:hypothetical protein